MLCALIMAGGRGERFWPLSTEEKPKQFLNLVGDDTMIQMTVKRLEDLIPIDRVFVVTAQRYIDIVKEQLPNLPHRNIIVEPIGKNTAPCIGLSAFIIDKYYKDATIAVLPSDHLIREERNFRETLNSAYKFVQNNNDAIVTLGMKPDRPETGYGYIKCNENAIKIDNHEIKKVEKFVEKPSLMLAEQYLQEGNFLWNGGMFIWKTNTILKLIERHLTRTYNVLSEIAATAVDEFEAVLQEKYDMVESVSVDYGIMEKANNIYVIPSNFGWDDIGNWTSIERYKRKDNNDNITNNNCFSHNSSNNIVLTNKKIILNGVENLIIVETDDYIMISTKQDEQEIKVAKNLLNREV